MLYAESSAVLAWLLGQPAGEAVAALLRAESVVASELTLLECDRVLLRIVAQGRLAPPDGDGRTARLATDATLWSVHPITPRIVERARGSFPDDAICSLDAIHLATALALRMAGADVEILSLDERVRSNGRELGFRVLPD